MPLSVKSSRPLESLAESTWVSPATDAPSAGVHLRSRNWGRVELMCSEKPFTVELIYSLIKHSKYTHILWSGIQTSQSCSLGGLGLMTGISKQESCYKRPVAGAESINLGESLNT